MDFDITRNIKQIEEYKCSLLESVSRLFISLSDEASTPKEKAEILSDILTITYILGDKVGVSFQNLDTKALSRLKAAMLHETCEKDMARNLSVLYRHLDKTRNL